VFHETVDFLILLASVGAIKVGTAVLRQPICDGVPVRWGRFRCGGLADCTRCACHRSRPDFAVAPNASVFPGPASLPTRATTMR